MPLRRVAAITILALLVCACTSVSKPSDPTVSDVERRHDEMMRRMGGGSGM